MVDELLDSILVPLADLFESRKRRKLPVSPSSPEEWEPLRNLLAEQFAKGLMIYGGTTSWNCIRTDSHLCDIVTSLERTEATVFRER